MMLGAESRSVCRLIVGEVALLVVFGTGLGLIGGIGALVTMRGVLFGVESSDASILAAAALLLGLSAALASYLPARRAAHIDPVVALRCE